MAHSLIQRFVASHDVRASRWGGQRRRLPDRRRGWLPYLRVGGSAWLNWSRLFLIPCWSSAGGYGVASEAR